MPPLSYRNGSVLFILVALTGLHTPRAQAEPVPVAVAQITQIELSDPLQLVGSVLPRRNAALSVQVGGLVQTLWVDEGSRVAAGEKLLQLDDHLARIQVQRSRAQVAQAEAERAEAQRKYAEALRLREQGHIPASAVETAQTERAVADAVLAQTEAEHAAAQETLKRHTVRAPFAGTITRKHAELGQWLNTGSTALQLVDTAEVRIEVAVPQAQIGGITPGTQAAVVLDSFPNATLSSRVTAVIPRGTDNARTVPIWLTVTNPDGTLLPGMSARVRLGLAADQPLALAVPNDALVRRADGQVLLWLVQDAESGKKAVPVPVTLGRRDATHTEVISDTLQTQDLVVVRGNESLRPGQAVYVVEGYMVGGN